MYNGIINVYKERGFTSFDVVAKLRGILGQKKIGHTGTLDPDAEGVLPVCLGSATKVCDLLTDRKKTYEAILLLGIETDTQDTSGTVLERGDLSGLTEKAVRETIASFVGEIMQVPPMYSALKVNGQRLYDLARKGQTVERKARPVTIYRIDILEMRLPFVRMEVTCSKGTYIRTLCHDIGERLGCHGALSYLLRTRVAGYTLLNALSLAEIEKKRDDGTLDQYIRPVDDVFSAYPAVKVLPEADRFLYNGNPLRKGQVSDMAPSKSGNYRIYDSAGKFCAVYQWDEARHLLTPVKMFL